ncbi:unnamed protein product [Paramecium primaurelia]|uniref:NadR/Ttd14 AAA domain-containing protein n=1 Tax=Paramecium primaurelia TaxID=5886 RepID=A0A8S1MIZ9_PARPR|nr:unnamed protein product [Paramecium primaurelia]
METDEAPKPKKAPYKSKRYFLSSLNTYFGYQLIQQLRNDTEHPEDPNLIVGTTILQSKYPLHPAVRKVIDPSKMSFLQKVILDSDVIVYDINTCDHSECEYAIKTLKLGSYDQEKILILVSSVMAWSATDPKEKKAGEEDEDGGYPPESGEEEGKPQEDAEDAPPKKEYTRFNETDYPKRKALPQYESLCSLESLCLSINRPNLKTFILCAGILYGMGEDHFYTKFKEAWLQNTITFYNRNKVPCIHVKDLALFVQKLVEKPVNQKYIFAIDHNQNPSHKAIIDSISKGVGNQKIQQSDVAIPEFQIDLRMKPTKVFDAFLEEQGDQGDEEQAVDKFTFNWWCKEGIRANIAKIRQEFVDYHNLKPIRIAITGPPGIGKSTIANQISTYFSIPHITIKELIQEYLNQTSEEVESLKANLEENRNQLVEEAKAQYDIQREKRKQLKQPYIPFDDSKIEARLTDEQLITIYKWRLMQNDCQNRGFILDNYPKTYAQAKQLFYNIEGEGEEQKVTLNKLILPEHFIVLGGSDEQIIDRIKFSKTHKYDEEVLLKRLKNYKILNTKKGYTILIDFYKELKVDICEISVFNKQTNIQDTCRSFIERNGKYKNYKHIEQDLEENRLKEKKEQLLKQQEQNQKLKELRDKKEDELWKIQEEEYKIKQEHSVNYEKELLESRSLPLRQYLNDNVVPFITEGLVEIVKQNPENVIDFLSEFLFKRSLQVRFPDPKLYFENSE